MRYIEQGDIWYIRLEKEAFGSEQGGKRPFLVISSTSYNTSSKTPIGFILSTSPKKRTNKYTIPIEEMSSDRSHVNVSQIRTVSKDRFLDYTDIKLNKERIYEIIKHFQSVIIE